MPIWSMMLRQTRLVATMMPCSSSSAIDSEAFDDLVELVQLVRMILVRRRVAGANGLRPRRFVGEWRVRLRWRFRDRRFPYNPQRGL